MSGTAAFILQHMASEGEETLPFMMKLGVTCQRFNQNRKNSTATANGPVLTPYDFNNSSDHGTFIL
eukprot:11617665-Karenia_brevis.AAC.1